MNCQQTHKLISANFDGELNEKLQRTVAAHLDSCADCRRFASQLSRTDTALDSLAAPKIATGFTRRVLARLPDQQVSPGWCLWPSTAQPAPVWLSTAALCCGIFLGTLASDDQSKTVPAKDTPKQQLYSTYFQPLPDHSVGARYFALVSKLGN